MITNRLNEVASRYAKSIAIVDGQIRLSYGELAKRKSALAGFLREHLGLRAGDVLALSLPNCWEFVAFFFAAAELGVIVMPFNTGWRAREIGWFVSNLSFRGVITNSKFRAPWDSLPASTRPRLLVVDEPDMARRLLSDASTGGVAQSRQESEDDPAVYLATSGSTGKPKIVPRTHRNLVVGATNIATALPLSPGQILLGGVPFYHANGFNNCMFLPLATGATVVLSREFHPAGILETIQRERVQVMNGSPFLYSLLADHAADPGVFSTLAICISSGSPLSQPLAELWRDRFHIRVRQLYGSSETGTISIETGEEPLTRGLVGPTIPGVEVRILGQSTEGDSGEIAVRSPGMMSGYVGEPELNRQVFCEGFFRTGDLGRLDENSNLVITGRSKRIISVGGIKVDPVEIENVIEGMPGVRHCHVRGQPGARELELIKAVVVIQPGFEVSRSDIVDCCRRHLAEHKIPRIIEFSDRIPTDFAGKTPVEWTENHGISNS